MFDKFLLPVSLILALAPLSAAAQDWRTVNSFRQHAGEGELQVELRYGAGQLLVEPGTRGELYRVGIRYDSDAFDPLTEYRPGLLKVGVEGGSRSVRLRDQKGGDMKLALSPDVMLDLRLAFGAVEANMELGGLHVSRIKVETGASDSRLRFSAPNATQCHRLDLSMGAAAFRAVGLGNADCSHVNAEGGVGDMDLDFSGVWRRDMTADITMALGSVTLTVPEDVGVVVRRSTFLTSFSGRHFTKRGRDHYSDNWDQATRKLTVELQGAFGSFTVRRASPSSTAATL
jgi:hypothetical protein